jgi:hypothetical protein
MSTTEAGREMDALIAEKVMIARWVPIPPGCEALYGPEGIAFAVRYTGDVEVIPEPRCPHYSTDIADAWLVVEEMHAKGRGVTLNWGWDGFVASFDDFTQTSSASVDPREGGMPLAICRAALDVMKGTV